MSGSDSGVITSSGRDGFSMNLPKNPTQSPQVIQNMRLAFTTDGTAVYQPITAPSPPYQSPPRQESAINAAMPLPQQPNSAGGESIKKKRGRPRKYGPDGTMSFALASSPPQNQSASAAHSPPPAAPASGAPGFPSSAPPQGNSAPASANAGGETNSARKARGRPPGSLNKKHQQRQFDAHGPIAFGFTPHIITVRAGEDISSKIMSFSQNGPRAVCILSANGCISNVTLRQSTSSGGTITYEGRFEIVSLSGSFTLCERGGPKSRSGGLSVSLSGPDGRILGGVVAGLLIAATPVQVVVGSFAVDGKKESKPANHVDPSGTARFAPSGSTGASSPQSRGTLSESSGGPGSPLNQNTGASNNNNAQGISSMPWK